MARLQNDRCYSANVLAYALLYFIEPALNSCLHFVEIIILDRPRQPFIRRWNARMLRLDRLKPRIPRVIPRSYGQNDVPPRRLPRDPNRRLGRFAAGLDEADLLGARHHIDDLLGDFRFQFRRQGERDAIAQLLRHSIIDLEIVVPQRHRRQPANHVQILMAVHIDDIRPVAVLQGHRKCAFRKPLRPLAQRLRPTWRTGSQPREHLHTLVVPAHHFTRYFRSTHFS